MISQRHTQRCTDSAWSVLSALFQHFTAKGFSVFSIKEMWITDILVTWKSIFQWSWFWEAQIKTHRFIVPDKKVKICLMSLFHCRAEKQILKHCFDVRTETLTQFIFKVHLWNIMLTHFLKFLSNFCMSGIKDLTTEDKWKLNTEEKDKVTRDYYFLTLDQSINKALQMAFIISFFFFTVFRSEVLSYAEFA